MYTAIKASRTLKIVSQSSISKRSISNGNRSFASKKQGGSGWNSSYKNDHILPSQQFNEGSLDFSSGSSSDWQNKMSSGFNKNSNNSSNRNDDNNKYNANQNNWRRNVPEVKIDKQTNSSDPYRNLDKSVNGSSGSTNMNSENNSYKSDRNWDNSQQGNYNNSSYKSLRNRDSSQQGNYNNSSYNSGGQKSNFSNNYGDNDYSNSGYSRGSSSEMNMKRDMNNNRDQPYWASQKNQSNYAENSERRFDRGNDQGFSSNSNSMQNRDSIDSDRYYTKRMNDQINQGENFRDGQFEKQSWNRDRDFSTRGEGSSSGSNYRQNAWEERQQRNRNFENEKSFKDPVWYSQSQNSANNSRGNYREQPWEQDESKSWREPTNKNQYSGARDSRQFDREEGRNWNRGSENRGYYASGVATGAMENPWNVQQNNNNGSGLLDKTVDLLASGAHKAIEITKTVAASGPVLAARDRISEGIHNLGEKVKERIGIGSDQEQQQSNKMNSNNQQREDRVYYQPRREEKFNQDFRQTRQTREAMDRGNQYGNNAFGMSESAKSWGEEKMEDAKDFAKDKFQDGKNMASNAWEKAKDVANDKMEGMSESAKSWGKEKMEDAKDFAKDKIQDGKNMASNAWDSAKQMASEKANEYQAKGATETIKDTLNQAKEVGKEQLSDLGAKASNAWEKAKDFASEKSNEYQAKGTTETVKDTWNQAKDKLSDLSASASETAEKVKDKAKEYKETAQNTFVSSFMNTEMDEIERDPNRARVALVNEVDKNSKKDDYSAKSSSQAADKDGGFNDWATNLGLIDRKENPQTREPTNKEANSQSEYKDASNSSSMKEWIKDSTGTENDKEAGDQKKTYF